MGPLMTVTEAAAEQIKSLMTEQNFSFLRIGVEAAGCSGLGYMMRPEASASENDSVIEEKGVKILVDLKSQLYLAGLELDYFKGPFEEGFVFNNPNVTGSCGCGKSFSTN